MKVYICLDDRNGLLFNKRRQSRDGAVLADIRESLRGELTVAPYSEKLIREARIPCTVADRWDGASEIFLEEQPTPELLEQVQTLVIYRWNRHYPADVRWDANLTELGFALQEIREFPGTSHDTITREEYAR